MGVKNHNGEAQKRLVAQSLAVGRTAKKLGDASGGGVLARKQSAPNRSNGDGAKIDLSEQLKQKAINGFLICLGHFNRPWDQGRTDAVLILLGHACEMLMKAAIVRAGGSIHSGKNTTISLMDSISELELSPEGRTPILSAEDVIALRIISALRNNAQHFHVVIPEEMLYYCASNGVRVFRNVMNSIFNENPAAGGKSAASAFWAAPTPSPRCCTAPTKSAPKSAECSPPPDSRTPAKPRSRMSAWKAPDSTSPPFPPPRGAK